MPFSTHKVVLAQGPAAPAGGDRGAGAHPVAPAHPHRVPAAAGARPRRPGRPPIRSDEATLQLILDAAMDAFVADGFAGTGMSAVAQRAGVSTKTLYRLVPTKAELFHKVVAGRTARFVLEIDHLDNAAVEDVYDPSIAQGAVKQLGIYRG